jgi:cytochrome P450
MSTAANADTQCNEVLEIDHGIANEPGLHTRSADVAYFDILDPAFRADSPEVLAAQEAGWYAHTPLGPAVLRHAEAAALLRDRRLRPGSRETLIGQGVTDGPAARWWLDTLLNTMEPPDHTRLRRLVSGAFTARRVEQLVPALRRRAHDLIDAVAREGRCDFLPAFGDPYPLHAICEILAVPDSVLPALAGWADELGMIFNLGVSRFLPRIEAALAGLHEGVDELLALRRREPGDDLVSALIQAGDAGDRLSPEEVRAMIVELIFASTTTTRNQLARAMVLFAQHPQAWALLRRRPELATNAVEEVMRLVPTMPAISRVTQEDVEVNGLRIPTGTFLLIVIAAANTDPRVFDPVGLDITRPRAAQLTFGGGAHHCLGSWLARIQMREAFAILAQRMPTLEIDGEPVWRPTAGLYGPNYLPLRWDTSLA